MSHLSACPIPRDRHRSPWAAMLVPITAFVWGFYGCADHDEDHALHCDVVEDQVTYVYGAMREYYLWNEKMPRVAPHDFDTPEELLEALRYQDDRWSGIYPEPEVRDFYAGRSIGLGFRMLRTVDDGGTSRLRIALVYEESPAEEAGLERGMTLLEINGKTIEEIDEDRLWGTILGEDEVGVEVSLKVAEVDGTLRDITATKAELHRTSVFLTRVLPVAGMNVGYVMFEQFIDPSREALAVAFSKLKAEHATHLVLDLRYNTGGLLDVTRYLASLIVGAEQVGEPFLRFDYNSRQKRLNQIMEFGDYANSIGFDQVAFLVGGSTASASEALINGLRPYVDVHLVGFNTLGKPVGSNPFTFCQKILQPITFALNNVKGVGGYFDGIPPDCEMDDDLDHQLGNQEEGRLAAALSWLQDAPCPEPVAYAAGALAPPRRTRVREALVSGPGFDGYYGVF